MSYHQPTLMLMVLLPFHVFIRPSNCTWAWVWVLWPNHFGEMRLPLRRMSIIVRPSVCLFTTFSGFSAFADKSLERNITEFGLLIYPADIDADGFCCHLITFGRQRVLTTVLTSALRPSVCPSQTGHYHLSFLKISAINLKYGGMMHSTMEQVAV